MAQGASGVYGNNNAKFGFADIKYGQRIVELALKYSF